MPTSLLDAVNTIVRSTGEAGIVNLSPTSGSLPVNVASALGTLDEVRKEVLARGWWFNTDSNYPLPRDAGGEFPVPAQAIRIDVSPGETARVTQRGGRLYDRDNHRFTFERPTMPVEIIWELPWDDLPEVARQYIAVVAARRYQARYLSSREIDGFAQVDELRALVNLQNADAEEGNHSIFNSYSVTRVLDR